MGKDNEFMWGIPDSDFITENPFDYNTHVGLRERIAILMATNFEHIQEDDAFRLARRIEDYVITGATGITDLDHPE